MLVFSFTVGKQSQVERPLSGKGQNQVLVFSDCPHQSKLISSGLLRSSSRSVTDHSFSSEIPNLIAGKRMSKNSSSSTKKKKTTSESPDEVEELLKAAQDDVLLKLTINSHMAHSSSQNYTIDPDLDSRFQSLKSKKSKPKLPKASAIDTEKKNPKKDVDEGDDDILARFSALKKSLPSYSESARAGSCVRNNNQLKEHHLTDDSDDEEDEVEKVIKWAKDAARLDPSPSSDIEDSDDDDDDDGDTEEDSDEEVLPKKTSKKRW